MSGEFRIDVSTPRGRETALVVVLAIVAGVWAAFSRAAPTGLAVWDEVLVFGLASAVVAVVLISSPNPRVFGWTAPTHTADALAGTGSSTGL